MKRTILLLSLLPALAQADIKITTWNIEHLVSGGRVFGGGFAGGGLPLRIEAQLGEIGDFIKNKLESNVLAIFRIEKQLHNQYVIVMKQLSPDAYQSED